MSHHHDHLTPKRVRHLPEPTIQERLWGTQERLHDIARRLRQPGPHGAQYVSDLYEILGALKVATTDIQEIIGRATALLSHASEHGLTSRPCTRDDGMWLGASQTYAHLLAQTLDNAQTAINDIGGHLAAPAPPSTPPRN